MTPRWPTLAGSFALLALGSASCGFAANTNVRSDQTWTEITRPGTAIAPPTTSPTQPRVRPAVVAVFDLEDRGAGLSLELRESLSSYLAMTLAASARFHVVPRAELKKRLREQKRETYRKCYDQSCQIEIGRELAAQKTLATVLLKVGKQCAVTAVLYDLRRATSEDGASVDTPCEPEAVVGALKKLVAKLGRPR